MYIALYSISSPSSFLTWSFCPNVGDAPNVFMLFHFKFSLYFYTGMVGSNKNKIVSRQEEQNKERMSVPKVIQWRLGLVVDKAAAT